MLVRGTRWAAPLFLAITVLAPCDTVAADEATPGPDMCLAITDLSATAWASVVADVADTVAAHATLFPDPLMVTDPTPAGAPVAGATIAVWATGGSDPVVTDDPPRLAAQPDARPGCAVEGPGWRLRFERGFLDAAADRMLADAPTTPGFSSSVDLEWAPGDDRVRTTLTFSGPFGVPNGTCWIDESLASDAGRVVIAADTGMQTSPLGDIACGRFFEHLGEGGAGAQAVSLVPVDVEVPGASGLRFGVTAVDVTDDAILVSGLLGGAGAVDGPAQPAPTLRHGS
jgi:hypothetical protein